MPQISSAGEEAVRASRYGELYCPEAEYGCTVISYRVVEKKVRRGRKTRIIKRKVTPKWEDLWPDETERDTVRRINRTNGRLRRGMKIAFPVDLSGRSFLEFSPLPHRIKPPGERLIVVELGLLAFGAYEADGTLVRWGPISGGRGGHGTPAGSYRIKTRHGRWYRSGKYPEGCGEEGGGTCAPMPYAMHFRTGYALHGGYLPGRHASHGCIRMYTEDARWLNHEFVKIGTAVVIRPYPGGNPYKFYPPSATADDYPPPLQGDQPDGTTHGARSPSTVPSTTAAAPLPATDETEWSYREYLMGPAWAAWSWTTAEIAHSLETTCLFRPRTNWIDRLQVARRGQPEVDKPSPLEQVLP